MTITAEYLTLDSKLTDQFNVHRCIDTAGIALFLLTYCANIKTNTIPYELNPKRQLQIRFTKQVNILKFTHRKIFSTQEIICI